MQCLRQGVRPISVDALRRCARRTESPRGAGGDFTQIAVATLRETRGFTGGNTASRARISTLTHRRAFTLVELLVVTVIVLALAAMTLAAVRFNLDEERLRSATRELQSFLEGARSRAVHAHEPRGVRLLLDGSTNIEGRHATAHSIIYIGPSPAASTANGDGRILLERPDFAAPQGTADSAGITIVRGLGTTWYQLQQRQLLSDGSLLTIIRPDGSEAVHAVLTTHLSPTSEVLELVTPYRRMGSETRTSEVAAYGGNGPTAYRLELPLAPLPGAEPRLLPAGTTLHLDASRVPGSWRLPGGEYGPCLDIVFSPRGMLTGPAAALGVLHLVLADSTDAAFGLPLDAPMWAAGQSVVRKNSWVAPRPRNGYVYQAQNDGASATTPPVWPTAIGETVTDGSVTWRCFPDQAKRLVSIHTQTGRISTHEVYQPVNNQPLDPFRYAEAGEVAGL